MTMHLIKGVCVLNTRKPKQKITKAKQAQLEQDFKEYNKFLKSTHMAKITLPTPKQEQLAFEISKNSKNYKIICIGGSLAIASGVEKAVPKIFYSYEFLWRLRYDTLRRIKRLLNTFFYFYIKKFTTQKLDNLKIEVI